MSNFGVKVDLLKLRGAMVAPLNFGEKEEQCLIIPLEGSGFFQGKQGIYLDLTAVEMKEPKYGDSHFVKQSIAKEEYLAMTKEERDAQPILGALRAIEARGGNDRQAPAQSDAPRAFYDRPSRKPTIDPNDESAF